MFRIAARGFVTGTIPRHNDALLNFDYLFNTSRAEPDAKLFGFATDVDRCQFTWIKITETMLTGKP